ncbi:MAG: GH3 auxin-responsive promoter family protein [Myxococcaceae bacterium]|nr:GH3 auxin-responsive promoter family protein [Myxococcaceae bacterium]
MSLWRRALFASSKAALRVLAAPVRRSEARALENPAQAQEALRQELTRAAARTERGRSLGLDGAEDLAAFRAKVPLVAYEALEPWIERQRQSDQPLIAPDRVKFFETTSGSNGHKKLVPYTAALQRSMTRMFLLWASDVLERGPTLETGLAYFSVSPRFQVPEATAGTPIGVEDDRDYLEGPTRALLEKLLVMVPGLPGLTTPGAFHDALLRRLLEEPRLEVISIWSPTFLLVVLEHAERDLERYAAGLEPDRAQALRERRWDQVWPALKLISCWADGGSVLPARQLAERFPGVLLQPKGLLATEAPLTYPRIGLDGGVPLLDEVFFEFLTGAGDVRTLAELQPGEEAEVVISQRSGLLRYRLGDRVAVTGLVGKTPALRFLGRSQAVSDLVGEKLNEAVVAEALAALSLTSSVLIPDIARRRYVLVTPGAADANAFDRRLQAAFHYQRARQLGQLEAPAHVRHAGLPQLLQRLFSQRGMKLGDLKDRALLWRPDEASAALEALERP